MLAIVIPYYKKQFFEANLLSLSQQTDKRFRVYVGDDASLEDPSEILEKYKDEIDISYLRFDKNLGGTSLVKQWERCLSMIRTENWIMILGDDDVLGINCVEAFYRNVEEVKEISVYRFATVKIDHSGKAISEIFKHPKIEMASSFMARKTRSSLGEYIFKRTSLEQIGFKDFPLAWYSDILAVLECSYFGNIFSINEAVVYIRISDLSISGSSQNGKQKAEAVFEFHYYLLNKHRQYFTAEKRKELFVKLNKTYVYDKKKLVRLSKISFFYLKNFLFGDYLRFIYSIILSLTRN